MLKIPVSKTASMNSFRRLPLSLIAPKDWWLTGLSIGLFTFIVFNSLYFLARFPHGTVVPPWKFPLPITVAFALLGALVTVVFSKSPRHYLQAFFLVMVLSSGAYILRFPILDEWLCLAATIGGAVLVAKGGFERKQFRGTSDLWPALFLLWMLHLAFMSLYGWAAYSNPKALRFLALYLTLFGFSLIHTLWELPRPTSRQLTKSLLLGSILYYLLVLAHWKIAKSLDMQPHILEGIGFAGTAYLCLVSLVAVPLALNEIVARKRTGLRLVASITLALAFIIALLSDSRAGFGPFLVSFGVAAVLYPFRALKAAAVGVVASVGISLYFYNHPHWLLDILGSVVDGLQLQSGSQTFEYYGHTQTAARGDAGRILYVLAGVKALLTHPEYFLTGAGNYSFFPVAGEHYDQLAKSYGVTTSVINYGFALGGISEPPRPPALGAYTIETGFLGITLCALCSLACLFRLLIQKVSSPNGARLRFRFENVMYASLLLCVPLWLYFGEIQDVVFLYLLIAPNGILSILGDPEPMASA
jgi:hypothetical protein